MPRLTRPSLTLCALAVLSLSCGKEEITLLVEEEGVWELVEQDVDGATGLASLDISRQGKFLARFTRTSMDEDSGNVSGKVALASCIDVTGEADASLSTACTDNYRCDCFDYNYSSNSMSWTFYDGTAGEPMADTDTGGGGGGPTKITVDNMTSVNSGMILRPLPWGVMGCAAESCQFTFQGGRANSKFEETGCHEFC